MNKSTNAKKKVIGAALTVSLAAGTLFTATPLQTTAHAAVQQNQTFKDLDPKGDDYASILALAAEGIIVGYPDGTFKPGKPITRQQAAKIIAGSLGLDTKNVPDPGYTDLDKKSEYYGPIAALTKAGIVGGSVVNGKKVFKPANTLSRAQMSQIIALAYELPTDKPYTAPFKDVTANEWHAKFVQAIYDAKVTQGQRPGIYGENNPVTRGQMALFIDRAKIQDEGRRDAVTEGREKLFRALEDDLFQDTNGEASLVTSFDRKSGAYTIKVNSIDGAFADIQNTGFFSDKMPRLGVTSIKIGDNAAVDITKDMAAAKEILIKQAFSELKADGKGARVTDLPVNLKVQSGGYEFEQPFKLNVSTETPMGSFE
ncbi:S-layer homology domain-containing protein [Bhargavaea ullalensis]|uniref:SLH domain-containing protein n=1 Tax=Bhargavaea ullalensis TaxID=1265685 RepID=A0ABV2GAW6_9BACL